jgi:hypothetical protein
MHDTNTSSRKATGQVRLIITNCSPSPMPDQPLENRERRLYWMAALVSIPFPLTSRPGAGQQTHWTHWPLRRTATSFAALLNTLNCDLWSCIVLDFSPLWCAWCHIFWLPTDPRRRHDQNLHESSLGIGTIKENKGREISRGGGGYHRSSGQSGEESPPTRSGRKLAICVR